MSTLRVGPARGGPKRLVTLCLRVAISRWSAHYRRTLAPRTAIAAVGPPVDLSLVTLCGHRDAAQAAATLLSFRSHVGCPVDVVVGDDGSLTAEDRRLLATTIAPAPVTFAVPEPPAGLPHRTELEAYARAEPMGRKLCLVLGLSTGCTRPVLYTDSDVLFGTGAAHLRTLLVEPGLVPRFMADPSPVSHDLRLALEPPFVNAGFLLLPPDVRWDEAVRACAAELAEPEYFTEQSVVHVALRAQGAEPLPPDRYVLRTDDVWRRTDHLAGPGVAARHYISPIRWKFWVAAFGGYRRALWALVRG